ncbi:hypothetical protein Lalb_Chr05g0227061 [Lupinus albus]|uniref:Uncharacterized protein n=1 Tax=Lupinus albus TaxID=3870 RepID=A0A6A4QJJ2_LUPAL|nr:hypothetical protein Lalb_Chr05g0227061 [Lupinus albus]
MKTTPRQGQMPKSDAGMVSKMPSLMRVLWACDLTSFEQKAQMAKSRFEQLRSGQGHDQHQQAILGHISRYMGQREGILRQ